MVGMLSLSMMTLITAETEEVYNHQHSTVALTIAEAGIEHALQELRADDTWTAGFAAYTFPLASGSTYTVTVDNTNYPTIDLQSTGAAGGFNRALQVSVVVEGPPEQSVPYPIRIDAWSEQ